MRRAEELSQLVFKHGAWWRGTMVIVKLRPQQVKGCRESVQKEAM